MKCSVCNEKFENLNDLCNHKDNELCKDNFSHIISTDNTNPSDVNHFVDEEIDEDSMDLEIDLDENNQINFTQNVGQEKKRTRRKYTKNKNNSNSNLSCGSMNE